MRSILSLVLPAALLASLAACGGPAVLADGTSTLKGQVLYSGDARNAPGAVVELMLIDISNPDTRSGPLARERIDKPGGPPVSFRVVYNVRSVKAGRAYAVCARARDAAGDVTWASSELRPVRLPSDENLQVPVTDDSRNWVDCKHWSG